ncbi:MAG TPA: outer membrane beta-barrel protein, partial [bacterium]|nr:outer membrane beta-barrel protein [bacterium]
GFGASNANVSTFADYTSTGYFNSTSTQSINASSNLNTNAAALLAGLGAGYNFQFGNVVVGFDGSLGSLPIHQSAHDQNVYPCCSPAYYRDQQTVESDWVLSLSPRLGYSFGKLLVMGSVGLAFTDTRYEQIFTETDANGHESKTMSLDGPSLTGGADVEWGLTAHWILRADYQYLDIGRISSSSNNLFAGSAYPSSTFRDHFSVVDQIGRLGLDYRF